MAPPQTNIDLYTSGTPNGQKINCTLEELGLKYNVHKIDISKNEQKEERYLKINPNGRIPAIVDNTVNPPKRIFEGGAIMLYLTARYDPSHSISFPYDSSEYWEMVEWIVWMQSGLGPMQGQANHFYRYAPKKIGYAIDRYQTETKRLYQVLEERLAEQEGKGQGLWLVGGKYTIADLCCFSWVNWAEWAGVETKPFARMQKWLETIQQRPAVEKGVNIPDKFEMKEAMKTKEGEEEYTKYHSSWVMRGQEADQENHK
ncbi:Glutathione S-transferase 2 [Cryomyces antarcticus]|uniref:Glutathione S-transferase 2 n=1 Tax=Cryomyces antarcticus TaxID=329879 RepID=A0ABR0M120_9PEZI|nr:Glutathione S-transferase 2 [Cryomyces antarcticus]KAK5257173.1 Glutathione S-transferase 2 [Cryomyces antarcticus]